MASECVWGRNLGKPLLGGRRRWWVLAAAPVLAAVVAYLVLPWLEEGVSLANGHRIAAGMTRQEVEALLGPPNHLPDLARTNAAFWDAYTTGGCRYVSISVQYDAEGRVSSKRVYTFWRSPWER